MSGTPLNPARFAGLMATVAKSFPLGRLTDEVCQSWENNGKELARRLAFLAQMAPEPKRVQESRRPFDEVAFFHVRFGFYVDGDLEKYVGLQVRATRGAKALKPRRQLLNNESEATMFGVLGSPKHAQTLANAVDLGQIAGKIEAQKNGEEGELLTDGSANIFPVRGLDGTLHVVLVRWDAAGWHVDCRQFRPDRVWDAGRQVFSN